MNVDLVIGLSIMFVILVIALRISGFIIHMVADILIFISVGIIIYAFYISTPHVDDKYVEASKTFDKSNQDNSVNRPHPWFDINTYW